MQSSHTVEPLVRLLPLWSLALILVVVAVLSLEAGAWWGRRQVAKAKAQGVVEKESPDSQGYIIGSIFGLLAFLIGLTFSMALDRYDDRRSWVAEEATAIRTAYERADLFDEPYRGELRSTLRQYAQVRVIPDDLPPAETERRNVASNKLRERLWQEARWAIVPVRETELGSSMTEAMNNTLDVGTRRELAGRAHVPAPVLDVLFLYLVVAAAVLGSLMARENVRQRFSSTLLIVLFVLGMVLILDVDRPRGGTVKVSQRGLEQLVASMQADQKRELAGRAATR